MMKRTMLVVGLLAWSRPAGAQGFTINTQTGLDAVRSSRPADWWLSGAALIDLDGDGDLDVYLSSHGSYGALAAVNDGKGHFTVATGTYPTTELHLPCDVDEDGKVDFSATYADGGGQWWLNRSGAGGVSGLSFLGTKVIRDGGLARQQALVDIDGDGKLDWLRGAGAGVLMDFGDGKGSFAPVSRTLANPGGEEITVVPVDVDGDGDQDLLVEWGRYDTYGPDGATRLYRNDGAGTFTNVTTEAGLYEMGLALQGVGDVDQDGDTDLIVLEKRAFPHTIFLNDGRGHFTKKAGAISNVPAGTAHYGSWGLAALTDFDNDGIADIIVDGRNYLQLLRGTGGGTFSYVNKTWGGIVDTAEASVDAGFSFGDIDGDGDLDLIGYKTIEPRYLNVYVNELPTQNWVNVRPVGLPGNKAAVGAEIRIYAAGTTQLLWYEEVVLYSKQVQQNYYALGETERHFGLGARATVDVTVHFPGSNKLVRRDGVAANSTVRISEDGAGVIVPPPVVDAGGPAVEGGTDASTADVGGMAGTTGGTAGNSGAAGGAGASGAGGSASSGTGGATTSGAGGAPVSGAAGTSGFQPRTAGTGGCGCVAAPGTPAHGGAALVLLVILAGLRTRASTRARRGPT
jgi:hypothetical protein